MNTNTEQRLDAIQMCFLIGMGRSGTTLLTQMLNVHEEMLATPENRFVMTFWANYKNGGDIPIFKEQLATYYKAVQKNKKLTKTGNFMWDYRFDTLDELFNEFNSSKKIPAYSLLCKAFLLGLVCLGRDNDRVKCIVDKNPDYSIWISHLLGIFPNAKFIVAVRDYRAVSCSKKYGADKRLMGKLFPLEFMWNKYYAYIERLTIQYPDRFLTIRYEDLTEAQETFIKQICNFLKVPFNPNILLFHEHLEERLTAYKKETNNKLTDREHEKWGKLAKPVNTSRKDAWKTIMTEQEILFSEWWCGKAGLKYGYIPEKKLILLDKIKLAIIYFPKLIACFLMYYLLIVPYYYIPLSVRFGLIKLLKLRR